jgi:hypothetical protein
MLVTRECGDIHTLPFCTATKNTQQNQPNITLYAKACNPNAVLARQQKEVEYQLKK